MLAVWGVLVLVGFGLISGLLESALSSEADVTSSPESKQAEDLIDFMLGDLRAKLDPVGRLDVLDDVGRQALAYFASVPQDEPSRPSSPW